MSQPAPIPMYLILGAVLLCAGVPCVCSPTFIGCQPSVFPLNPDRKPIFPLRKKKHAAPPATPVQGEASAAGWRGSKQPFARHSANLLSGCYGVARALEAEATCSSS